MSHTFEEILQEMEAKANSKSAKGTLFEEFIQRFLTVQPPYSTMFENVWLWSEFPYNGGKHDYGIDLVARKKDFDEYVAIQCKFYSKDNSVSKEDVDTFISASGKSFDVNGKDVRFTERIIISTTDKWTSTAEDTINGQKPPVNRIRLRDFKESGIDWEKFSLNDLSTMKISKKTIRPHQKLALSDVLSGFQTADRGKLIMACGTGKTYTALKIMEAMTQGKGNVLFLVPSISLLNQTLVEWTAQCAYPNRVYAVCSDPKASKNDDNPNRAADTVIPATTDIDKLIAHHKGATADQQLSLFFSTYQSIEVISQFQKKSGIEFDLVICDEAHRTTGVTLAGDDESAFVRVHDNNYIQAKKRLYMTATPRIYGDESKNKANQASAVICSMDDENIYGKELHRLGFADAVAQGLLTDYKVLVLAVDEAYANKALQRLITDKNSELQLPDAAKILGCYNGLSKRTVFEGEEEYFANDPAPMKRAVAFCSSIKNSQQFVSLFRQIEDELKAGSYDESLINVDLDHVDGKCNVLFRKSRIEWLKAPIPDGECRVLSNARCLSEGIDVPALDAVMFLNPRNSIVDIIQSVGRVMRKSDGKKFGYIILPIGIPAGEEPETALGNNDKYKIVWDVLQALRAHDDRFNDTINKIDLNKNKPDNISIIGVTGREPGETGNGYQQLSLPLGRLQEWKDAVYAKIVKKCGSRRYWETWAKDIADIANRHIEEIKLLIKQPTIAPKFKEFLEALRANLNSSITQADAIEMLAEHMITKPVFDALFENYEFIKSNPVSIIMQDMLDILDEKALDKEQETLDKFYASVQQRAKGIDNAEGKQRVVIELYEQFFRHALKKQVEKLGIVYTPVEVVNFILQSVEAVLQDKFGSSINDDGVHILDPFTGTGTFIVQLLRSGLIRPDRLLYKYTNEIHANEIVLLAYYIACVNIEETFHDIAKSTEYIPFEGIVLTDTFAMTERQKKKETEGASQILGLFSENSARANRQLGQPITVIIGNPPYSVGQKTGNDNNQNTSYEHLDSTIATTYGAKSKANNTRAAYDTYIKAFRWATDRLGDNGVIGFVTNGAYLDSVAFDGFRQCLLEDFNSVYVFNLRGNARTSGEQRRKEKGNVFGEGSRTPVAITILVRKKGAKHEGFVRYHDIGDYLSREEKLAIVSGFGDIRGIKWSYITPNENHDWLNQRNQSFSFFISINSKRNRREDSIFSENYSIGIASNRDVWMVNFSKSVALDNIRQMIETYNSEMLRCFAALTELKEKSPAMIDEKSSETFLINTRTTDPHRISWSRGLTRLFCKKEPIVCDDNTRLVHYRPFCKKTMVYNKKLIEYPSKWDKIYPLEDSINLVICVSSAPLKKSFSVLITDCIQDQHLMENSESFPLYMYDKEEAKADEGFLGSLFGDASDNSPKYKRRYALSDTALKKFQDMYGSKVTKEDIFYYLYAVLQSKQYIENYADNLSKEMPRIPMLEGFFEYVKIGRQLAELHLGYERIIDPAALGLTVTMSKEDYTVSQIKFAKDGKDKKKDTIIFNPYITISGIPERAYEYVVNGRSAIEWIMESYRIKTDKDSGITDDPNTYGDEKYIFNLLISIIDLSIRTQDLLEQMPEYKEI
ncbi:MAG: DEAD/DEAH box helicase [Oscillospiraceae bacterium]|nr:DEAD/DEAH box helicase [Oscillospiraceae bacterium]